MHAVGDYVSNMAGDFFNTDYLRQKVVKAGMQVQTGDVAELGGDTKIKEDEVKVPKFKSRQQNFVSQSEIDKNTSFYMTRLKLSTYDGGYSSDAVQRFDEFNRHLGDFPFAKGKQSGIFKDHCLSKKLWNFNTFKPQYLFAKTPRMTISKMPFFLIRSSDQTRCHTYCVEGCKIG